MGGTRNMCAHSYIAFISEKGHTGAPSAFPSWHCISIRNNIILISYVYVGYWYFGKVLTGVPGGHFCRLLPSKLLLSMFPNRAWCACLTSHERSYSTYRRGHSWVGAALCMYSPMYILQKRGHSKAKFDYFELCELVINQIISLLKVSKPATF